MTSVMAAKHPHDSDEWSDDDERDYDDFPDIDGEAHRAVAVEKSNTTMQLGKIFFREKKE